MAKIDETLNVKQIKDKIIEYSNSSLEMEEKREQSILDQSSSNLTVVSILVVALFTILFELLDRLPKVELLLIIFGIILSCVLFISIFFAIKAQWRYKRGFKRTVNELLDHINCNIDEFSKNEAFQDQLISDINEIQRSIAVNNDKRINDIIISSVLIYVFLFLLFIFGITILIVL